VSWDDLPREAQLAIGAGVLAFVAMVFWSLLSGKGKGFIIVLVALLIVLGAAGIGVSVNR
jgi:hypothetical protein